MSQINLQDVVVTLNGVSRHNGNQYDMCHVEMLLVTSEPLSQENYWYIPKEDGSSIPPEVLKILNLGAISMYPQHESTLKQGLDDTLQQALDGNTTEVYNDAKRLLLLSLLKKMSLTPVVGSNNVYSLKYDYKLYPNENGSFEFSIQLPFDTLTLVPGGRVQCTVVAPINSIIDAVNTKGLTPDNQEIQEENFMVSKSYRPIVAFDYQNDPTFTVSYHY